MYRPTNSAIGMVQAMVKVPQELPGTICVQAPPSSKIAIGAGAAAKVAILACTRGRQDVESPRNVRLTSPGRWDK